jgi:predicted  nucleic acid-binding Zn-ribbon protein
MHGNNIVSLQPKFGQTGRARTSRQYRLVHNVVHVLPVAADMSMFDLMSRAFTALANFGKLLNAAVALQVSELSHKLGSAEGSARSLEQEVAQLRSQAKALAGDKHELELQLANMRAQLAAAQEKVSAANAQQQCLNALQHMQSQKLAASSNSGMLVGWPCCTCPPHACHQIGLGFLTGCSSITQEPLKRFVTSNTHGLLPASCQLQSSSQGQLLAQQQARLSDLEGSVRQWEERCADLRDLVAGHEGRCKEAAAEVMKGNEVIEKLQVRWERTLHR